MSQSETMQDNIIAFLLAEAGDDSQHIETHISHVVLGITTVFKLKREVVFPYLDYGTVLLRHQACEKEVALNRRFAPELYRGVRAITRDEHGNLAIDGQGEVIDWVVEMKRFPDNARFDIALNAGKITRHHIQLLGDNIWKAHQCATVREDRGGSEGIAFVLTSNRAWLDKLSPDIIDHHSARLVLDRQVSLLELHKSVLDQRRAAGAVRICHGDMHMANLILLNDQPLPFDAIEFNDWIGSVDTLYDLSFPAMDLIARGHSVYATHLLNRYMDHTGAAGPDWTLLPFFLSYRATVRALVEATSENADGARRYLELAARALTKPQPALLAIGGLSGSGKSRLARALAGYFAPSPGARIVRTDAIRKRIWGQGLNTKLPEAGYSPDMSKKTYEAFYDECRRVITSGGTVIADAVFARGTERQQIEAIANELGVPFLGLWLETDLDVRKSRVVGRAHDVSDATPDVLDRQMSYRLGPMAWVRLKTDAEKSKVTEKAYELLLRAGLIRTDT